MFGPRPSRRDRGPSVQALTSVFLREVTVHNNELWLFGNNVDRASVAVQVRNWHPHVLLEHPGPAVSSIDKWKSTMVDDLKEFAGDRAASVIVDMEVVERVHVIGFTNNEPVQVVKLTYNQPRDLHTLRKFFESPVSVPTGKRVERKRLHMHHDDWEIPNLFLFERKLSLQTWVDLQFLSRVDSPQTYCQLEYKINANKVFPGADQRAAGPVLVGGLRGCALSALGPTIPPKATNANDELQYLCLSLYWLDKRRWPTPVRVRQRCWCRDQSRPLKLGFYPWRYAGYSLSRSFQP